MKIFADISRKRAWLADVEGSRANLTLRNCREQVCPERHSRFVRKDIVDEIPEFINSIRGLKNRFIQRWTQLTCISTRLKMLLSFW